MNFFAELAGSIGGNCKFGIILVDVSGHIELAVSTVLGDYRVIIRSDPGHCATQIPDGLRHDDELNDVGGRRFRLEQIDRFPDNLLQLRIERMAVLIHFTNNQQHNID